MSSGSGYWICGTCESAKPKDATQNHWGKFSLCFFGSGHLFDMPCNTAPYLKTKLKRQMLAYWAWLARDQWNDDVLYGNDNNNNSY
jgi:hypothetical protein